MLINRLFLCDVDGTLIDRDGAPAPAWDRVHSLLEPTDIFALCSSRTAAELFTIQASLGLSGPLVAENGSLVVLGAEWWGAMAGSIERVAGKPVRVVALGSRRSQLTAMMRHVATACNLTIETTADPHFDVNAHEGRGRLVILDDATTRQRSLLVQVAITRRQREMLGRVLAASSLSMVSGGRWEVVQSGSHKGIGATVLRNMLHAQQCRPQLIAIGDGANDRPMMDVADMRFVMRRADGAVDPALADLSNIHVPEEAGPAGWDEILSVLAEQEVHHA